MRNKSTSGGRSGGKRSAGPSRNVSKGKPGFKSKPSENKNRPAKGERSEKRGDSEGERPFSKSAGGYSKSGDRGGFKKPFRKSDDDLSFGDKKSTGRGYSERTSDREKPYGKKESSDDKRSERGRREDRGERSDFKEKRGFKKDFEGDKKSSYRDKKPFGSRERSSSDDKRSEKGSRDDRGERSDFKEKRGFKKDFGGDKKSSYGDKKPFGSRERSSSDDKRSERGSRDDRGERSDFREKRPFKKDFDGDRKPSWGAKKPFERSEERVERSYFKKKEENEDGVERKYNGDRNDKGRYARLKKFDELGSEGKEPDANKKEKEHKPFKKGEFSKDAKKYAERPSYKENKGERKDGKPLRPRTSKSEDGYSKKKTDKEIRLNKFIANAGLCSRREADAMITAGVVSVNGQVVTELGCKVDPSDEIRYNNEVIKSEKMMYVLLNKPKDFITTTDDPEDRRTVMALIENACRERIYPVGRLDRATTGLLLFTNDGDLTKKLTHPSGRIKKIYHVEVDKTFKAADMKAIAAGIELEDGFMQVDEISYVGDGNDKKQVGVEIHSGKNRIVRRLFESLGYKVLKLDRVYFAGLTKKDLARGKYRFLTPMELNMLKML